MKHLFAIVMLLALPMVCFGQSSYKGLTPGQSARANVERVLGGAVKELSKSFAEYKGTQNNQKIFAQYDGEGPAATVLRIELVCLEYSVLSGCGDVTNSMDDPDRRSEYDAIARPPASANSGKFEIKGEYSPGRGTITGTGSAYGVNGQWKDATGGGTMSLKLKSVSEREATTTFFPFITGTWERTSGKGPKTGTWEGRCVETKADGNQ